MTTAIVAWIYVFGALVGLLRVDAPPLQRVLLAVAWPVALVACVVTLTVLGAAAVVLFPAVGVGVALMAGLAWWLA